MDIDGAIDLHVHTAPDVYPRSLDDRELLRAAEQAGLRAVLLKSHHTLTADRATLASAGSRVLAFGGLALNLPVGGLNPVAVETAVEFGARTVWMPTLHARHCLEVAEQDMFRAEVRRGRQGITVLAPDGSLSEDALAVLEVVRDAGVALGTGHLAPQESLTLLRRARDMGLPRVTVTHPLMSFTRFSHDALQEAARLGGTLEFDYLACSPGWPGAVSPRATARAIRAAGPEHCVIATDGGQASNPPAPEMLRAFAQALLEEGIAEDALRVMMRDNPARILGI